MATPSDNGIASSKRHQRESIWLSTDVDTREIVRQLLLANSWPEIVTYDGPTCGCSSPFGEGSSTTDGLSMNNCALMSMYCARKVLDLEKQVRAREYRSEGRSKEEEAAGLIQDILAERTVQRIVSIGNHLKGASKMGVNELLDVPLFEQVFLRFARIERFTSYENILEVLDRLCKENLRRIAATIITQSFQTIVCVKMSLLEDDMFVVFDPHSRLDHPNGPSFCLSTSRTTTATVLNCLLDTPLPYDVTDPVTTPHNPHRYFTAHLLNAKESYHKITAYQNEETLRDVFLCSNEEALSTSVDYVTLWNQLVSPDIGLSKHLRKVHTRSTSSSSSSSSSSKSISDSAHAHPLPPLPTARIAHVSESWRPETQFGQTLLEQLKSISQNAQVSESSRGMKFTFDCAVCLDTYPVLKSVQLSGCDHRFCKECLRGHVQSFLGNGRFPIQCPVCLLDTDETDPGNVTYFVLDRLQMPQNCADKFQELQVLQHSVRLECPSCQHSDLIPRKDYLQTKVLNCSSRECRNKWCKNCRKSINDYKGKHVCKGDGFEKLVRKKGWRYCPGCTMPILKESGCNHMICTAPGCNTHFCYKCGKHIITSATGRNVGEEVTLHYTGGCRQFERKLKCSVQ